MRFAIVFLTLSSSVITHQFPVEHECIDFYTDFNTSEWIEVTGKLHYAPSPENLPVPFDKNLEGADGMFYFEGDSSVLTQSIFRNKPEVNGQKEYVYLRYYAHHESAGNPDESYYLFPSMPSFRHYLLPAVDYRWKETLIQINSTAMASIAIAMRGDSTWIDDYLFIDKIIYAQSQKMLNIGDVKALCTEFSTTAPPIPTTTESFSSTPTESFSSTPTESFSSTTESFSSTTESFSSTTMCSCSALTSSVALTSENSVETSAIPRFTSPPPRSSGSNHISEWIDVLTDLDTTKWSSSTGALKYAPTYQELPEVLRHNMSGTGIFYFQASPSMHFQALARTDYDNYNGGGDAYLYLRYYIHHTSGSIDSNSYVVFPVVGTNGGTVYLDVTPDLTWKEIHVQLDHKMMALTHNYIGLKTQNTGNYFLIDRLIYNFRPASI